MPQYRIEYYRYNSNDMKDNVFVEGRTEAMRIYKALKKLKHITKVCKPVKVKEETK